MSENNGYVKFNRCDEFDNLVVYNRNAYVLLSIIAKRATRFDGFASSKHGKVYLNSGEALIGDYDTFNFTESEYRSAKKYLIDFKYISVISNRRGTIAKLLNTKIFNINIKKNEVTEHAQEDVRNDVQNT